LILLTSYEFLLGIAPDFNPAVSKLFINVWSEGRVELSTACAFDVRPIPYASRIRDGTLYVELKTLKGGR